MKRFVIFLIAVTVSSMSTFAYEYLPFVKEGCVWELVDIRGECWPDGTPCLLYKSWFEGDTVINGETYKKLQIQYEPDGPYHSAAFLQEKDKRVYLWGDDNRKHLMYDFNYHKGDTIPPPNKLYVATIVIDEDTIVVKGISRRRLTFKYNTIAAHRPWHCVEGIGNSSFVLSNGLYIYYENGVPVFGNEDFLLPHNGVSWIEPVKATKPQNSGTDCYDLMGRRIVGTPSRGIYLKGGRKYLVK